MVPYGESCEGGRIVDRVNEDHAKEWELDCECVLWIDRLWKDEILTQHL
jgi:hypothetical protein